MAERTVEVAIKARDEASQVLKDIVGTFGSAARSTEQFREDLAQTDEQFGKLLTASKELRSSIDSFKSVNTVLNSFKKLSDQVGALNVKLKESGDKLEQERVNQQAAAAAAAAAAAEYNKLKASLTALNAEQAQVAARQAQLGKAVTLAGRLNDLTESAAKYQTKLREIGVESAALVPKQRALQQEIERLNASISGSTAGADDTKVLEARRKAAEKELASLTSALSKLEKQQVSTEGKLAKASERFTQVAKTASEAGLDINELRRPVKDLEKDLEDVTQQAGAFAGKLAPLNTALKAAEASSRETAAALKQSDAALASSQANYQKISTQVEKVSGELEQLRAKLQAAGVDTTDLAAAQNKLQEELESTQRTLIKTEGSINRYATTQERASQQAERTAQKEREAAAAKDDLARSTRRASDEQDNFLERGRTALSFFQRLRGQVLSLVSAYVGLFGVINQTRRALEVGTQLQGAQTTLLAANDNDQAAAAAEFEYTAEVANRLGQDLLKLTQSYAKLRVASAESGISLNATRLVFEALNESATVLRLSADQTERVFYAVTQIFSKGKITAEELTQQLGDNLPGALALLAKGLGLSEAALLDQVKAGEVTSASLIALAIEARKTFGGALPQSLGTSRAEFNRLNNEITILRAAFFQSAEESGLAKAIRDLTVEISRPEVIQGVQNLGKAFVELIKSIPIVIEEVNKLLPAIRNFAVLFIGGKLVGGILAASRSLARDFVLATDAAAAGASRLAFALNNVFRLLTILVVSYSVTEWLRTQSETVDKWADRIGAAIVYVFSIAGKGLVNLFNLFSSLLSDIALIAVRAIRGDELFAETKARAVELLDELNRDIDGFIAAWENAGQNAKGPELPAPTVAGESNVDEASAKAEFDRKQREAALQSLVDAEVKAAEAAEKKRLAAQKKAADERARYLEQVRDAILEGEQDLAESRAELSGDPQEILEAQLKAVEEKYRETYDKISKIKGAEGEEARARLAKLIADEQDIIRAQASTRGGLVTELQDALLEATGRGVEVELANLKAEFDRTVAILKQTGQTEGIEIARNLFSVQSSRVQLNELLRQYDELTSRFQDQSQQLAQLVEVGDMTQIEAQKEQNRLREEALAQVQALIPQMQTLAAAVGDPQLTERVRQVTESLVDLRRTGVERTVQQLQEGFASGLTNALDSWIMGIASAKDAFAQFAADFLRQIAQMIIQQQILNLLQQSSGAGGIFGAIAGAAGFHTGGVIGRDRGTPRLVNPAIFAAAQRYHSGGMVGLRSDEVPAILQRGEEVLSRSDPRNAMNGGGVAQPVQVKVVNTIDSGDFVTQGLNTARGQEAVLNVIRANKGAL